MTVYYRTLKNAQWALWLQLPILMVLSFSTAFAGLTIYAKYQKCDPILQGRITASDQVNIHFCKILFSS